MTSNYIKKFFKIFFSIIFFYIIIAFSTYTISAIFLVKNKILNYKILVNYQRNFYNQLGFRKIWQTQKDCIDFDVDLIFKPKNGKCFFENPEFKTELNFNDEGRKTGNNLIGYNKNIAVIGDSFAMGWGVNDQQTFAALIEKDTKIKTYNLGVSGYATERSLIRLKKSNLLNKIDTVIIQYCPNDFGENQSHSNKKTLRDKEKAYEMILTEKLSFFKRLRKAIRYSFIIPFEVLNFERDQIGWKGHDVLFEEILKKYSFLSSKKIIVISMNGPGINFYNFPNNISPQFSNLRYLNIKYNEDDFFSVDGHLNEKGHKKVAKILSNYIKNN